MIRQVMIEMSEEFIKLAINPKKYQSIAASLIKRDYFSFCIYCQKNILLLNKK